MKILYQYLFFKLFIYLLIILPSFTIVVILAELIELFRKIKIFDYSLIGLYVVYQLPEKVYYILPISVVISFILLAKDLIDSKEIYPILLNGISLKKIGYTLFFFPLFLSVLQMANLEFVMPKAKEKTEKIYQLLKGKEIEKEKYIIAHDKWVALDSRKFLYFEFLDLNKRHGRNLVYLELDDNFEPKIRVDAGFFSIEKNKIYLEKAKLIDFSQINSKNLIIREYLKKNLYISLDMKSLKKLFKVKKPISISDFYKSAKIFEKFGYSANVYWSKFYSLIATIVSPLVLSIIAFPLLWSKKKDRLVLTFVLIIFYWYGTAFFRSLAESGAIPYLLILSIDILYTATGIFLMEKLKFTEV